MTTQRTSILASLRGDDFTDATAFMQDNSGQHAGVGVAVMSGYETEASLT
jgi:hypothetical protein